MRKRGSSRRTGARSPEHALHRAHMIAARRAQGGMRCFYCRRWFSEELPFTFDHYVPYRYWRTQRLRNLVLACEPCNQAKGDALPWVFAALLLKRVRMNPVWWMACMPASAAEYEEAA